MKQNDLFPDTAPKAVKRDNTTVTLNLFVHRDNPAEKARLMSKDGLGGGVWVPKDLCRPEVNREGFFTLPNWLAVEKGLL